MPAGVAVTKLGVFDADESALVEAALVAVTDHAPADAEILRHAMIRLAALNQLVSSGRPLRKPTQLGGEKRTEDTLIEHLCSIDGLSGDLVLPFKATLARTYLLAKINFLRGFAKATSALANAAPEFPQLTHQLTEELAQSIYTLLAEELFLALLRKPYIGSRTKQRAANQLITIWDNAHLEIDDFAPLLESAWHARNRVTCGFGCLLGTTEYFKLVVEDCAPQVLDFFARDGATLPESESFEEFLFNMTYEELQTLRETMRAEGLDAVTSEWAAAVLGRPMEELDNSGEINPTALYRSYNRRQLAADFRLTSGRPGPRLTAEGYLMVFLLDNQARIGR